MIAVKGYFDGFNIKPLENVEIQPNQKVIITIMDDFVEPVKKRSAKSLMGILSEYADPKLREQEEGAWERAVVEKYSNVRYEHDTAVSSER